MKSTKPWMLSNPDLCQYRKVIEPRKYLMIQVSFWSEPADLYAVCRKEINLDDYDEETILEVIGWYGYLSIEEVYQEKGKAKAERYIAKCLFECMGLDDMELLFVGKEPKCNAFIEDLVNSEGVVRNGVYLPAGSTKKDSEKSQRRKK